MSILEQSTVRVIMGRYDCSDRKDSVSVRFAQVDFSILYIVNTIP